MVTLLHDIVETVQLKYINCIGSLNYTSDLKTFPMLNQYSYQGFIQWGEKLPPQNTQLPPPPPPQKEREKEEKRKRREREREREREVHGGGRGVGYVYFCVALQVISIVSYFMTQLFKSTR